MKEKPRWHEYAGKPRSISSVHTKHAHTPTDMGVAEKPASLLRHCTFAITLLRNPVAHAEPMEWNRACWTHPRAWVLSSLWQSRAGAGDAPAVTSRLGCLGRFLCDDSNRTAISR